MRKISLILFSIFVLGIFIQAEDIYYVKKKDGFNLPNLEDFELQLKKRSYGETYKNCYSEDYRTDKIENTLSYRYFYKIDKNKFPYIEIEPDNLNVTHVRLFYYKSKPFCYELFNINEHWECPFFDMDLDGIFELELIVAADVLEYFLKFSPAVDEDDKWKDPIYVGQIEIK